MDQIFPRPVERDFAENNRYRTHLRMWAVDQAMKLAGGSLNDMLTCAAYIEQYALGVVPTAQSRASFAGLQDYDAESAAYGQTMKEEGK